jgi:L-lactate dehydrogenase complex protein LldE
VTCLIDSLLPEIGEAAVKVLRRIGYPVDFPPAQTCCGQPAYNAGHRREARQVAAQWLRVFTKTSGPIVTPSGSCAAMVRHGMADLFHEQPAMLAQVQAVAERTFEFSEFLTRVAGVTDVGARWPGTLTFHPSCHQWRGLGEREAPQRLLAEVSQATVVPLPGAEECCGFGGLFSVKLAPISGGMLAHKLENLHQTSAETCVTCDASCLLHIDGGLRRAGSNRRCVHLAEVLA